MKKYTVQQLADLAGVSVRTLHHYDEIGLLQPAERSEKGYRYYTRNELLRLQQIMFYKQLDMPLNTIAELMDSPEYNAIDALEEHRLLLIKKEQELGVLIQTINKTIQAMKDNRNIPDEELYEGFSKEQIADMRAEVVARWGEDELTNSEQRVQNMGKEKWKEVKQEAEEISILLASLMDFPVENVKVQQAVAKHYAHIGHFYEVSKERYSGLGKMYVDDARFTAYYEKYRPGLAKFLNEAIGVFCKNDLKVVG